MKLLRSFLILLSALMLTCAAQARQVAPLDDLFSEEPEFLPVDQAFVFDFQQNGDQLVLSWQIADGYYLYKKQFKTATKKVSLADPSFPASKQIEDEYFGISDVFYNQVDVNYPIMESVQDGVVKVRYQGCAEAGLCYPMTTKVVYLQPVETSDGDTNQNSEPPAVSEQFELASLLSGDKSLAISLALFLLLGIGLAFTPCVFPMYPILSGIVIGQGKQISTSKAFSLSFIYVQGMAITYSLLGLVVASVGVKFQAALQHPAILITLIVIFVLLALVMFGAWELQLPSKWQEKLNNLSNQQKSGNIAGVFLMGVISGLVASPCTTAPLTGILLYIAQTGDLFLGFSALYALSMGMGIPLILFGITGGKLLPKAGNWMNIVKATFGFMLLVVALVFVERMFDNLWTQLAWSVLGLAAFSYFYVMNAGSATNFWKGVRSFIIFLGISVSVLYAYHNLFPAKVVAGDATAAHDQGHPEFILVKDLQDFELKLAEANAQGKSVMVDLYADWCVACKEFEKYTFPDTQVQKLLSNTVWMQIDLTENTDTNLEFQDHFAVLGLPTILFFDPQGNELETGRVTGFMNAERFANHLSGLEL